MLNVWYFSKFNCHSENCFENEVDNSIMSLNKLLFSFLNNLHVIQEVKGKKKKTL